MSHAHGTRRARWRAGSWRAARPGAPRCPFLAALTLALVAVPAAVAAQNASCEAPPDAIRVVGAVAAPVTVTREEIAAMESVTARVVGHDGTERTYSGPTLRAVLDRAGVPGGAELEGRLSWYVVVEARDGYRVTFALAELDGGYWDTLPLLAFRRDGEPLDAYAGPFQVIAPDTPKHGRWARQVACLRVAVPE